jgi:hypothetical protein
MTQSNSRPRVKQDGIGDDTMKNLYTAYSTFDNNSFRVLCLEAIEKSYAKKATKDKFNDLITKCNNKATMLTSVTNFFLAGEGKGV